MMGWGSFSSAVGVWWAAPGCHGPWSGWAWAPALGRFGVAGVPMGVSGGAGSKGGGILPL